MGTHAYANFHETITEDQIRQVSPEVREAYNNLLMEISEDSDLDFEDVARAFAIDEELDSKGIMLAYQAFCDLFQETTGIAIWLNYLFDDSESFDLEDEFWELSHGDCYQESPALQNLKKKCGGIERSFAVSFG